MAFYKDFEKKTRQEKRDAAFTRGGFEDEGSNYSRQNSKNRSSYQSRQNDDKRSFGNKDEKRSFGGFQRTEGRRFGETSDNPKKRYLNGKNGYGEHMPRNQKDRDDRPVRSQFDRSEKPFVKRQDKPSVKPREDKPFRREEDKPYDRYRYEQPAQYSAPVLDDEGDVVPAENLLSGRNPIREALKSGRDIEKLLVARGELSGSAREIVQMAKERRIPVQEVDRTRLDAITHNHQGMLAFASAYQYSTVEAMLALAEERGEAPFLILLDGITDPHNLGAIIRTAECAGAHGVIVQERRAVGLTPAAVKASAGAVEYLPVARVTNLSNTLEVLKAQNIWAYAADMDGDDYDKTDFSGGVALVIGAEGEGVSRRVLDICDKTVSLPIRGKLDSLNASVAAGVLMYAVMRSR